MSKQIIYFDPRIIERNPYGETITVPADNAEEYIAHRAAILDPERGITLVDPTELPEVPCPAWFPPKIDPNEQLRADVDYLLIMGGYA